MAELCQQYLDEHPEIFTGDLRKRAEKMIKALGDNKYMSWVGFFRLDTLELIKYSEGVFGKYPALKSKYFGTKSEAGA
jgi:hypothetical protein